MNSALDVDPNQPNTTIDNFPSIMASTESSAIPLAELHANWQQTVQDEPSPLRIVKQGDTHGREETTGCKSTSTDDVTRLEPRFRPQAEMHTALKHMRPEGIRKAAGKENFAVDGKFSLSHAPEADPLRAMQDVERWARDDSPPQPCRRLGLSGALTVRKTRRSQAELKET